MNLGSSISILDQQILLSDNDMQSHSSSVSIIQSEDNFISEKNRMIQLDTYERKVNEDVVITASITASTTASITRDTLPIPTILNQKFRSVGNLSEGLIELMNINGMWRTWSIGSKELYDRYYSCLDTLKGSIFYTLSPEILVQGNIVGGKHPYRTGIVLGDLRSQRVRSRLKSSIVPFVVNLGEKCGLIFLSIQCNVNSGQSKELHSNCLLCYQNHVIYFEPHGSDITESGHGRFTNAYDMVQTQLVLKEIFESIGYLYYPPHEYLPKVWGQSWTKDKYCLLWSLAFATYVGLGCMSAGQFVTYIELLENEAMLEIWLRHLLQALQNDPFLLLDDGMFANLLPPGYKNDIKRWVDEDCPSIDIGGFVVSDKNEEAHLYMKTSGILAGVPFATTVFEYLDLNVTWNVNEGEYMNLEDLESKKIVIAIVRGSCRKILLAERTALNILTRASGVATEAYYSQNIAKQYNWNGYIAGTRKTTPGFKFVEKYALLVGGVATHRQDLSQMVMLKDNHIWSCGNITTAVDKARLAAGFSVKIEVECQSVEEAKEACSAGADIVMLDNFTAESIGLAAKKVKEEYPHVLIEASGGITKDNLHEYMHPYIDIISRGSLTQGYPCLDFSLKIIPKKL